jgi:hypothetical protein
MVIRIFVPYKGGFKISNLETPFFDYRVRLFQNPGFKKAFYPSDCSKTVGVSAQPLVLEHFLLF